METYRVHRESEKKKGIKKSLFNILVALLNNIDCASHYITVKWETSKDFHIGFPLLKHTHTENICINKLSF